MSEFDFNIVKDPQVFEQHRLPPHSDHVCFANYREISDVGQTSLRTSLNGKWFFHYATSFDSLPKDFEKEVFTVLEWQPIEVPGHLETQGFGHPHYSNVAYPWDGREDVPPGAIPLRVNVIGSYVTFFNRNVDWENCFICFEGVASAFVVYLNGHYVGYSTDSFTPAEFDLTPYLRDGQNRLAVRIFKYSSGSHLEDQDGWRLSGIFRSVYLFTKPPIHLEDISVQATLADDYQKPILVGQAKLNVPGALQLSLSDKRGALVSQCFLSDDSAKINFELDVSELDIKPWSAEHPHLYTLVCQVLPSRLAQAVQYKNDGSHVDPELNLDSIMILDDATSEACCIRIGFRRFELKNGLMCINGERIVFHGVNRSGFSAVNGRAVTNDEIYQDLLTMKRNNINAIRTSHYPNATIFYNYCDLLGFYVIDEANLETHGSWQDYTGVKLDTRTIPNDRLEWKDAVIARGKAMLERDKNHPCVVMWSCGNASFGGSVINALAQYFKLTDPSRLVHYDGASQDHRPNDISDVECQPFIAAEKILGYLDNHPKRPLLASAYCHSMGQSNGGLCHYAQLFRTEDRFQGGFIWDFKDQAFYIQNHAGNYYYAYGGDFDDYPNDGNYVGNGITFADGAESSKMSEVKFNYQNFEIVPCKDGIKITNYSLFTDLKEFDVKVVLQLNGEDHGIYTTEFELAPSKTKIFPVDLERLDHNFVAGNLKPNSEYVLKVSLHLKEKSLWAEAGFEVAFGQGIIFSPHCYIELPGQVKEVKFVPDVAESCIISSQEHQAQALLQAQALAHGIANSKDQKKDSIYVDQSPCAKLAIAEQARDAQLKVQRELAAAQNRSLGQDANLQDLAADAIGLSQNLNQGIGDQAGSAKDRVASEAYLNGEANGATKLSAVGGASAAGVTRVSGVENVTNLSSVASLASEAARDENGLLLVNADTAALAGAEAEGRAEASKRTKNLSTQSKIPVLTQAQTQALAEVIVANRGSGEHLNNQQSNAPSSVQSIIKNLAAEQNQGETGQLTQGAGADDLHDSAQAVPLEQAQIASRLASAQESQIPESSGVVDLSESETSLVADSVQSLSQSLMDAPIDPDMILSAQDRGKPRASFSAPVIRPGELEFLKTGFNYGVNGYNFRVLFSIAAGGLVSYQVDEQEFLKGVLKPNFWRAPTDNERSRNYPFTHAVWRSAGAYAKCIEHSGTMLSDCACVSFKYQLATLPILAYVTITYYVYGSGQIKVDVDYTKAEGLPDMPEFGVIVPLKNDYERLNYYARGPQPNYPDRKLGYPLGYYEGSSTYEEFELYLRPQECGNHCDTRFFVLLDKDQYHGIMFNCYERPFNFSALPWSPAMIEEALHPYELSEEVEQTFVKISSHTLGVGGDHNVGNDVADAYKVPNQDHHLTFVISGF